MAAEEYKGFSRTEIKQYLSAGWWAGVTIPQVLERQATLHPEKMALVTGPSRWTYKELLRGVRKAALAFAGLGFRQGDRVLLQLPNSPEFVLCYLGLQRIGAIPVLCLPRFSLREIDYLINLAGATSWITHPKSHGEQWNLVLAQIRKQHPDFQVITVGAAGPLELEGLLEPIDGTERDAQKLAVYPHDACALCHLMPTGGTTGLPKLVPRTHNDYLCNSRFRSLSTGRSAEDISLIATPITHNMAIEVSLVPSLWTGGTVVLIPSTAPGAILESIEHEKATFTILVPAQLHDLVNHPDLERVDLSSLRALCGAGDRVPPELITQIHERIGAPFIHVFGMAEGPCANTKLEDSLELVRSTVGFPICAGDEFQVVDEEGKALLRGQEGELVARGPGIFRGYFKAEVINRDSFLPGNFFRTGDLARIDREGRITLIGRRKDVIVRGGEKISTALIERYLSGVPEIARAAVAGIPDARLGERICAFIEPASGQSPTLEGIAQFFKNEGISVMLCPERIELVSSFPLTPVGKLDRARLREMTASLPALSEGSPQELLKNFMKSTYRIVGKSVPRIDGVEKVTGAARYAGDLIFPGMLHGKILRSPHPHARIVNIDVEKALKRPGVRGAVTGKDGPGTFFGFLPETRDRLALPIEKVRFIGEEVAAVAADTPEIAAEAVELIEVEYEPLPAVFDPEEALVEGAPSIHGHVKNNMSAETHMSFGDVEEGFAQSDLIREDTYKTQEILHGFIEPHAVVAQWGPGEKATLWASKQSPYIVYRNLSRGLNLNPSRVRIIQPHVGGGFGGKHEPFGLDFAAVLLSRKTGRPVKIVLDQEEIFFSGQRRHAMIIHVKLGLKRDGTIMACQMKLIADGGAYASVGQLSIYLPGAFLPIPLRIPNYRYDAYRPYTNKPFAGALRGHCIPQMRFALEGLLDAMAEELGIDPMDVRLKNAVQPGESTVNGFKITSCGLTETIERAAAAIKWQEKRGKRLRIGSKVRGVGMATNSLCSGARLGGHDASSAIIQIHEDGAASLLSGATDVGQGAMTVLCQILAEELGLDLHEVMVSPIDSEITPLDPGTYGSRVTFCSGNAVLTAARDVKTQIFAAAAPRLGANPEDLEIGHHWVYVREQPERGMPWIKAVREAFYAKGQPVIGRGTATPGTDMANFRTGEGNLSAAYSFGTQIAEVEVDLETGKVRVLRFIVAHDCGYPINPALMDGQLHGSVVHGMAQVLGENITYHEGLPLVTSLTEYGMPTAADAPLIETIHVTTNDEKGPFGAKESGEGSMISTLACVANAIYDATGVRIKEIPVKPLDLLWALKKQKAEAPR